MKDFGIFLVYSGLSTILFLVLLLSRSLKKQKANKVLILIFFCFLLLFLTYASSYLHLAVMAKVISPIGIVIPFILGPLIFQYVKTIYSLSIDYVTFVRGLIPFVVALLIYSVPQYLWGLSLENKSVFLKIISLSIPFFGIVYFGFYLFLSFDLLRRFRKLVKKNYSYSNNLDLKWLTIWVWGFVIFLIIDVLNGLLMMSFPMPSDIVYVNLFYLVLLIWYIGYYGVKQDQVFLLHDIDRETDTKKTSKKMSNRSAYSFDCKSDEFVNLRIQLSRLFKEQELFRRQHLSLKETADILNISDKKLSYALNICMGSNFYEYVNNHRINYFIQQLNEGSADKLTLLAIAYDSGFNSKATFNRVFKQQMGKTPYVFKKELNKKVS